MSPDEHHQCMARIIRRRRRLWWRSHVVGRAAGGGGRPWRGGRGGGGGTWFEKGMDFDFGEAVAVASHYGRPGKSSKSKNETILSGGLKGINSSQCIIIQLKANLMKQRYDIS